MIQANELRIGNKVKCPLIQGRIATVEGILPGKAIIIDGTGTGENLEGVPLSPEILQACGFNHEDLGNDPPYEWWVHAEYDEFQIWNFNKEHWILDMADQYGIGQEHFHFLHQLQNLYFALTGTELTINLEKVKV